MTGYNFNLKIFNNYKSFWKDVKQFNVRIPTENFVTELYKRKLGKGKSELW